MSTHHPSPESSPDPNTRREPEPTSAPTTASAPARPGRRTIAIAAASIAAVGLVGAIALGAVRGGADASDGAGHEASDAVAARSGEAGATDASGAGDDAVGDAGGSDVAADLPAAVVAQLAYVRAHWKDTTNDEFGYLEESDCVNFASQSLLERGWQVDDEWWHTEDGDPYASSAAWISSTAFRDYLEAHPERGTALTDDQRDQVKVGDIVQFDWDDSGDRDHTGIVTAVTVEADGSISIAYAGHTDATWDRTVDEAIHEIHPGGTAYYWSIAG